MQKEVKSFSEAMEELAQALTGKPKPMPEPKSKPIAMRAFEFTLTVGIYGIVIVLMLSVAFLAIGALRATLKFAFS